MDQKTKMSLLKRAGVCLTLVLLYGLFGALLHEGNATRDVTGSTRVLAKGQPPR